MAVWQSISKWLASDYRDTLKAAKAPSSIDLDAPIVPVAVVNLGLPRARSNQRLRYTTVRISSAGNDSAFQVATASSILAIFYIGARVVNSAAVAAQGTIYDATSGNSPTLTLNNVNNENLGFLAHFALPATVGNEQLVIPSLPIKCISGIRFYIASAPASSQAEFTIWWLEEDLT